MMRSSKEIILTSDSLGEGWSAACWDPLTGSQLMIYRNASALAHNCISILNDSYLLAADVTKPRLYMWPLNSQTIVDNLRLSMPGKISALTCNRNGKYIVAAIGEKLFIWQTSTGRLLRTVSKHYQSVTCLKFTEDNSLFVSAGEDSLVFIWSLALLINKLDETTPNHGFSDHTLPVKDIHLGTVCNKVRLVSVSLDRTARIYDVISGTRLLTLIFPVPLTSVCMDITECNLFVGCSDGSIRQFNLRMPLQTHELHVPEEKNDEGIFRGHTKHVTCLSVSVDCNTLLSGGSDSVVYLWDIPSRQITRKIPHKGPITTAIFTLAHANFRAAVLKPKVIVQPLQRVTEESNTEEIIEIISTCDNTKNLLNIEAFVESSDVTIGHTTNLDDNLSQKLAENALEIEKLKKNNREMYQYLINNLMKSNGENSSVNMEL